MRECLISRLISRHNVPFRKTGTCSNLATHSVKYWAVIRLNSGQALMIKVHQVP